MKRATMISMLWISPSDGTDSIEVMNSILGWAANTDQSTYKRMVDWIVEEYDLSLSTARAYVQLLVKLYLLEGVREGYFRLSDRARAMIAEPRDAMRILADQFLRRCIGMVELMEEFYEFGELFSSEIAESLEARFPKWKEGTHLEDRLFWLRLLKCILLNSRPSRTTSHHPVRRIRVR